MGKRLIELVDVSKDYEGDLALEHVNLYINDGEFLTLLGPSGCGKTTTLRLIAGFIMPSSGHIYMNGTDIAQVPPYKREINTVFQKYALFPHLNVFDNIAFGLRIKKTPKDVIEGKVHEMLKLVNLEGYGKRWVDQLSGGQQQRVAIARALVNQPKILLLDEPLGALDLKLRQEMQVELKRMQQALGITFVYVTHDQTEALTMSDTIVIMKDGVIQQIGRPKDIYNEPKNVFVADDIIATGDSVLKLCKDLKEKGAKDLFLTATFSLFTEGVEKFNVAYEEGLFTAVLSTNLTYRIPELKNCKWFVEADMSKYMAYIINNVHGNQSVSGLLEPHSKIKELLDRIEQGK